MIKCILLKENVSYDIEIKKRRDKEKQEEMRKDLVKYLLSAPVLLETQQQ